MRATRFLLPICVCLIASSLFAQEPPQPVRMMRPPPPLQWPTFAAPPGPVLLLPTPKVSATAPITADFVYPYAVHSHYFGYVRGSRLLDGTKVAGSYDWQRRW
jgi:hypothetical protein